MATETVQSVQTKQFSKEEVKPEGKQEVKVEVKKEIRVSDPLSRIGRAEAIIHRNVLWSLGAGVLPFPIVDVVSITAVQVKMLKELSDLYDVKFTSDIAQKLVGSLLSGLGSVGLGGMLAASVAKFIPYVGTTLGVISVPVTAGAFTHATGKVFLMHFESGGTVLDFDAAAMRSYFKREFDKAKETVAQVHQEEQAKVTTTTTREQFQKEIKA